MIFCPEYQIYRAHSAGISKRSLFLPMYHAAWLIHAISLKTNAKKEREKERKRERKKEYHS